LDLPPSSKVTGVRFFDADSNTILPVVAEPVNTLWSQGIDENSRAEVARITAKTSSSNTADTSSSIRRHRFCELAAILTIQRLPAAKAQIHELSARNNG
jgi:hypothetical protein